ncbi:hypothetical protein [Chengkuizengella axinellae]|uniref:Uncharacterized protein n=1 Tax=Chengkuizengella axinellae TaxID=3064388 RepID=A0ABT9J3V4_9BACL|nr:hypothetical protein [Chengkuizengella sp. 2205SS18-9]MDP5275654.1 hypothetical protein [Chengkuizengella sp. 2205SS18-9]
MGVFDESICDCCVCPMQCVLDQLRDESVEIFTTTVSRGITINNVEDFILTGESSGDMFFYPICNVSAVRFLSDVPLNLKPNKKSTGVCSCCEDPTNRRLNEIDRNEPVNIDFLNGFVNGNFITDIGEGIVVVQDTPGSPTMTAISICQITDVITNLD